MRNVKINEAESIFETFWDVGESYPNNEKYSCLTQYKINADDGSTVRNDWASVEIKLGKNGKIVMERDCKLEIVGYDIFRFCASLPHDTEFSISCVTDGKTSEILHGTGCDRNKEYNGKICGNVISHIKAEFVNNGYETCVGNLLWFGLSNAEKEKKMLAEKNPYDENWEGCFNDKGEICPQYGIYFDNDELKELRKKLAKPPFAAHMDLLRNEAKAAMNLRPEDDIGDYVHKKFMRFIRERDTDKTVWVEEMQKLAFVGLVDEDIDMLKMACRAALSVAHCRYFCESVIGVFPGATWHHRSFTEESICKALVCVLEWAGGLLTWHGKNIIYDAIIMKGLPRIDADIKTMDYIWNMNQGTAFSSSLVVILIALSKRYPRYSVRVDEAERDMLAMWDNYVCADGGSTEGPQYWDFTLSQMTDALYLLARHRNVPVEEYAPKNIKKSLNYAKATLSEVNNMYIPINDAHMNLTFSGGLCTFAAAVSGDETFKKLSNDALHILPENTEREIARLIFAKEFETTENVRSEEFISLPETGVSCIRRKTKEFGMTAFYGVCEKILFGHSHADKGSFILEANGKALLIDRGVCNYNNPYVRTIQSAESHNLTVAVKDGKFMTQKVFDETIKVRVLRDEYKNGVYYYAADVTEPWQGYFKKNIRRIISPNPYLYIIYDDIEISDDTNTCFILNTYGNISKKDGRYVIADDDCAVNIYPVHGYIDKTDIGENGTDGVGKPVNRLCMYGGPDSLITVAEIAEPGKSKVEINGEKVIYDGTEILMDIK